MGSRVYTGRYNDREFSGSANFSANERDSALNGRNLVFPEGGTAWENTELCRLSILYLLLQKAFVFFVRFNLKQLYEMKSWGTSCRRNVV